MKYCVNCGEFISDEMEYCAYCGTRNLSEKQQNIQPNQQSIDQQIVNPPQTYQYGIVKYPVVAAVLAILFGTFGVHKFYMNNGRSGMLRILFFWTLIPTIIGIIEGIIYLTDSKEIFDARLQPLIYVPNYPKRDKIFAGVLAILFGGFGAHHFYMKNPKAWRFAILFWTGIPFIIGIVQGIIYLSESLENFTKRYYIVGPNGYYQNTVVKYQPVAAVLAFLFGTFGAHKFYMNNSRSGMLRILFFWTLIPTLMGILESILYLTETKDMFNMRLQSVSILPNYPKRDKIVAGVLGILFGGFGAHHFYLRNPNGVKFALLFWTGIPFVIGIVQGIIYLSEPIENFAQRYYY